MHWALLSVNSSGRTALTEMSEAKVYVGVKADFREDGVMLPRRIVWEDGREYDIDRIKDIRQAAAIRTGGQGDRYTIMIDGKQSYLYFERSPNQAARRSTNQRPMALPVWLGLRSKYR